MLTDNQLKSDLDLLWNKMRDGGLPNPLDSIEQLSFLIFMKRLDEEETRREQQAKRKGTPYKSLFVDKDGKPKSEYRWSQWTHRTGDDALQFVKTKVFPFIKQIGGKTSGFAQHMANAEFKINKPTLLQEACASLDELKVSQQNQDVQGDVYEYMLGKLGDAAGRNGQFRTPRHIIRMMVQMIDPQPTERICDPAAGTAGFLVNAYQYILEKHTNPASLEYDEQGFPHHLTGETLEPREREFLQTKALTGFDNDSGMTMLRIGAMNLMLHGIKEPNFRYTDTLGKSFDEAKRYDVILANPPFKGAIDSGDVNDTLPARCKKTELLFLHLFLRLLDMGGRCAAISPEGVLFGSSGAHVEARRKLIEENRLEAVIAMPSGVFKPYAGVSTAVLIFTRGGTTDRIWFYDMEHDGFSLDDKRQPVAENDIADILECWKNRTKPSFSANRAKRMDRLRAGLEPLKQRRLKFHAEINRLTFENAIAPADDEKTLVRLEGDREKLAALEAEIHPLQREFNQLSRQFWVTKAQVAEKRYDLSPSRYRQVEQDEESYEQPRVTLKRLQMLDSAMSSVAKELEQSLE
jgi:type I restriction enzyme M protein